MEATPIQDLQLIFAGNARFTVCSRTTGKRFTYRCRRAKPTPQHPAPIWFLSVLTGSDNVNDYQYVGYVRQDHRYQHGNTKSRLSITAPAVQALRWFLQHLDSKPQNILLQADVYHEGRCLRCGRVLTTPESVAAGLGPVCDGKE